MKFKKQLMMLISLIFLVSSGPIVTAQTSENVSLEAMAAMLVDAENGQILFEKESQLAIESGAATKLLLIYIIYEAIANGELTLDTQVSISDYVYQLSQNYEIANIPLRQDFHYSVEELLQAIAVKSANGAALALVEMLSETQQEFLGKMEQKLHDWHLEGNQLTNIMGIPTDSSSSTAKNGNRLTVETIATIAYRLIQDFPEYLNYTKIAKLHFKAETKDSIMVNNSNDLLDSSMKPDGLMLTSTEDGHLHQILTVQRGNRRLLAIVLGVPDEVGNTTQDIRKLLDYGFSAFSKQNVLIKGTITNQIPVIEVVGGKQNSVATVYSDDVSLTLPSEWSNAKYQYQFVPNATYFNEQNQIQAPIAKDVEVGTVSVSLEHEMLSFLPTAKGSEVAVVTNESVEKAGWILRILRGTQNLANQVIDGTREFFIDLFN
ncbi:D-alanyl-D-alanine carboxypeptidase [Aerococcaceae bacterium zg-ZJ1578]|uniref:D-alanyl-D-alanine carboxypeptidase family protein n=1 Tax=Aerococcaceae bacterium zg-252 TaxID=2796928 RepID=UPI001A2836FD|nr:D-alanyl-D-alanine carboxypeptidase [Aerococcaceae bacterium zg-1578]